MALALDRYINPLDADRLRESFQQSKPVPFVVLEEFLTPEFAAEIMQTYPTFEQACPIGRRFASLNERGKVQVTDARSFPAPVAQLRLLLADPAFLALLSRLTGISDLLADDELVGGGMHLMAPGSHLDPHVDFNRLDPRGWHRRLNLVLFLNRPWPRDWGGQLEMWDERVAHCQHEVSPLLNRCAIFVTSHQGYHSVKPVRCPEGVARKSFATYYYTAEPPPGGAAAVHDTLFRARPTERMKAWVLMPSRSLARAGIASLRRFKTGLRGRHR